MFLWVQKITRNFATFRDFMWNNILLEILVDSLNTIVVHLPRRCCFHHCFKYLYHPSSVSTHSKFAILQVLLWSVLFDLMILFEILYYLFSSNQNHLSTLNFDHLISDYQLVLFLNLESY